jgi:hypothetical protein
VTEQHFNTQKAVLEKQSVTPTDKNENCWDALFQELLVYLQTHEDFNVPQRYPYNPLLARWVSDQRYGEDFVDAVARGKTRCHWIYLVGRGYYERRNPSGAVECKYVLVWFDLRKLAAETKSEAKIYIRILTNSETSNSPITLYNIHTSYFVSCTPRIARRNELSRKRRVRSNKATGARIEFKVFTVPSAVLTKEFWHAVDMKSMFQVSCRRRSERRRGPPRTASQDA